MRSSVTDALATSTSSFKVKPDASPNFQNPMGAIVNQNTMRKPRMNSMRFEVMNHKKIDYNRNQSPIARTSHASPHNGRPNTKTLTTPMRQKPSGSMHAWRSSAPDAHTARPTAYGTSVMITTHAYSILSRTNAV